jgi:hypothetical protein
MGSNSSEKVGVTNDLKGLNGSVKAPLSGSCGPPLQEAQRPIGSSSSLMLGT